MVRERVGSSKSSESVSSVSESQSVSDSNFNEVPVSESGVTSIELLKEEVEEEEGVEEVNVL